jgi:hypothetical protein
MQLVPEEKPPTAPPCAVCAKPAWWFVWEHQLCDECNAAVDAVLPTVDEIDRSLGYDTTKPSVPGQLEASNREYRRRMAAWVTKRKTARAA